MYTPPSNWNPFNVGNYATGAQGLIYEPLFLFDPIKNSYIPWLVFQDPFSSYNPVFKAERVFELIAACTSRTCASPPGRTRSSRR